jgi:hypothetical protein
MKAELKRKEIEAIKKENIQLKSITKEETEEIHITKDHEVTEVKEVLRVNIYKNYIPLCLIGVVGLGIYMYNSKQDTHVPMIQQKHQQEPKKEVDPFEF